MSISIYCVAHGIVDEPMIEKERGGATEKSTSTSLQQCWNLQREMEKKSEKFVIVVSQWEILILKNDFSSSNSSVSEK